MLYFAYGSNMNKSQMGRRCPLATPFGVARLPDHKLSERRFADIDQWNGSSVEGVLWSITGKDLLALDAYEGFPTFYGRHLSFVEFNGEMVPAYIYEMTERAKRERDGDRYSGGYWLTCHEGAVMFSAFGSPFYADRDGGF